MNIHIWDLQGQKYDLTFESRDVSLSSIQKKLYDDYQVNSNFHYFCANSMILPHDAHLSPDFFQGEPQIVMYNSSTYQDKSYPRVDNTFNFSSSRYSDSFVQPKSINKYSNASLPEDILQRLNENNGASLFELLHLLSMNGHIHQYLGNRNSQSLFDSNDNYDDDSEIISSENFNDYNRTINNEDDEADNYNGEYPEEEDVDESQQQLSFRVNGDWNEISRVLANSLFNADQNGNENENNDDYDDMDVMNNQFAFRYQPQFQDEYDNGQNEEDDEIMEESENEEEEEQGRIDDNGPQEINNGNFENALNIINNINNIYDNDDNPNENEIEIENQNENYNENQRIEGLDVELTPADQEAIGRLMSAGFDQMTAIQVYIACDRDEEAALNVLVSIG